MKDKDGESSSNRIADEEGKAVMRFSVVLCGLFSGAVLATACSGAFSYPLYPGPGHPETAATRHNEAGVEQYQLAHWAAAEAHFEVAIQAEPMLAEAHFNSGLALDRLGAHAAAAAHFKQAGELAPHNLNIIRARMYEWHMSASS
jgi:tetratricopeptide (TPR) repeat protein